jgi:molecular chaperone GrpE (heat shock protein)
LPSNNDPAKRPESQPSDLFTSVETRAMLEEFRELVRAGILRVTPENEILSTQEPATSPADPKRPATSESREADVAALDKQLLEWLERRRRQKAELKSPGQSEEAGSSSLRQKLIARLAQKILESWERASPASDPYQSLREQVVERLTEEILRRWQSDLE